MIGAYHPILRDYSVQPVCQLCDICNPADHHILQSSKEQRDHYSSMLASWFRPSYMHLFYKRVNVTPAGQDGFITGEKVMHDCGKIQSKSIASDDLRGAFIFMVAAYSVKVNCFM